MHIEFLARELRKLIDVQVHAFGADRDEPGVYAYQTPPGLAGANAALATIGVDVEMAARIVDCDVVALPHLVRQPGRLPDRPAERHSPCGDGTFAGTDAAVEGRAARRRVPAVVLGRADRLRGGGRRHCGQHRDAGRHPHRLPGHRSGSGAHHPQRHRHRALPAGARPGDAAARSAWTRIVRSCCSSAGSPGRRAWPTWCGPRPRFAPDVQLALCAGSPDTPELAAEITELVTELQQSRDGVVWIQQMLPRDELLQLLTAADDLHLPVHL